MLGVGLKDGYCFDDCVGDDVVVRSGVQIYMSVLSILYLVLDGYRVHWLENIFPVVHFSSWLVYDDLWRSSILTIVIVIHPCIHPCSVHLATEYFVQIGVWCS